MFSKSDRNAKTSSMGRSIGMVFSNSSTSSSFSQIGTIMTSEEVGCLPREPYLPECVEWVFSEVGLPLTSSTAMAIVVSSKVILLDAIHLSPVGQRARGCVPPREYERSQYEARRNGTHPPYVLYSLT